MLEVLEAVEGARLDPSARRQQSIRERRSPPPTLSPRAWQYDAGPIRTFQSLPRDFLDLKRPGGRTSLASAVGNVKPSSLHQVGLTFGTQAVIGGGHVVAPAPSSFGLPFMEASFRYGRVAITDGTRLRAPTRGYSCRSRHPPISKRVRVGPSNGRQTLSSVRGEGGRAPAGYAPDGRRGSAVARAACQSGVVVYVGSQINKARPRGPDTSKVIVCNLVIEYARLGLQYAFAKTREAYTADRCPGFRDSPRTGANLIANGRATLAEGCAIWKNE
ncbi:hypothetical protein JCM10295v2_002589 [Rhodotorula toruloides]